MKELIRMNQIAGLITEVQAHKMMAVLNENEENIVSFLKAHKKELINKLSQKFGWDEDDREMYDEMDIEEGGDSDGKLDKNIAGLGEGGLDFSFNKNKVKDTEGDANTFVIKVGGKTVYGIGYNF